MSKAADKATKLHPKLSAFMTLAKKRMDVEQSLVKPSLTLESINTGSTVLNLQIGGTRMEDGRFVCPGWPKGRMSEVFGRESSGKTTIALMGMAQALADNGSGLYVDIEHTMVDTYAETLGVDFFGSNVMRVAPPCAEEVETMVNAAALAGVDFIVIDSVAALRTRKQLKRNSADEDDKVQIAEVPRFMSGWMPDLQSIIAKTGTHVMFLNQIRDKIGSMGRSEETKTSTTGGNALKFYASIRMLLSPKMTTKAKRWNPLTKTNEEVQIATDILVKNVKNKIDKRQGHTGLVTIRYGVGIDEFRTIMNIALAYGVIKQSKNSRKQDVFSFQSESGEAIEAIGYEKIRQILLHSPEIFKEVQSRALDLMLLAQKSIADDELAKMAEDAITMKVGLAEDDDDYTSFEAPEEVSAEEMGISTEIQELGNDIASL